MIQASEYVRTVETSVTVRDFKRDSNGAQQIGFLKQLSVIVEMYAQDKVAPV